MKYCFTLFSVADLKKVEVAYGWFSLENISSFDKNKKLQILLDRCIVDTIYVYSQLISSSDNYGSILSGNLYITNHGLYSIDCTGNYIRIQDNSQLYIFRLGKLSKSFYYFLKIFSKKTWNIDIIFPFWDSFGGILSSKTHGMSFYEDPRDYINSIVPGIDKQEDIPYLAQFILQSDLFKKQIIIKKDGHCGWFGIDILEIHNADFPALLQESIISDLDTDFIIMDLIDTTDIEYRIYWIKKEGRAHILEVHGKRRIQGNVLHNISQWNELIRIDIDTLRDTLITDIEDFCTQLPELHGWLDVLTSITWEYYFIENNTMTGYLYEEVEQYFTKEWLDAVASCYK